MAEKEKERVNPSVKTDTAHPPQKKAPTKRKIVGVVVVVVILAIVAIVMGSGVLSGPSQPPEINTISTLEKIVNVSELSTFTAVYNGIAEVMNEKNPEKVDYYVSYEAKVDAGIDFEQIQFAQEEEEDRTVIRVTLPDVYITNTTVDIDSMDYIFINSKANKSTVSQAAYKACEADATSESAKEEAILVLAQQNAENIIRALIEPFIQQLDSSYTLEIE